MHREGQKAKLRQLRRTRLDLRKIYSDRRKVIRLVEMILDDWEDDLRRTVDRVREVTREEAYHLVDLMTPKSYRPKKPVAMGDYFDSEFRGLTPNQRIRNARKKTLRRAHAIYTKTYHEAEETTIAITPDDVTTEWARLWGSQLLLAEQEAWNAGLRQLSIDLGDVGWEVIDHYEHLATLDELTCEECASLDGRPIPGVEGEIDESLAFEMTNIHPRCRCIPVPVSKTWRDLGFDVDEPPQGERIARPYYPEGPPGERNWGKSSPGGWKDKDGNIYRDWEPGREYFPGDSVQNYVPADIRYEDWRKGK